MLLTHLSRHARESNKPDLAASLKSEADKVQKRADEVRKVAQEYGSLNRDLDADAERTLPTRTQKRARS